MALTADDFLQQMIAQGRVLDPSISFLVGTPEYKLLVPVAQELASNQVDMTGLSSALDINAKYGTNLDQFVSLFNFQRQTAQAATGYVVFSRPTPAPDTISIPAGITLQAVAANPTDNPIQFQTTAGTTIAQNATESPATPIACVVVGTAGNVAANTITQIVGANIPSGVTAVTNPNALTNGIDQESDANLKTRFSNTWARNLAGTEDQYLALAVAGVSTKANVIGAQSRWQEYVQIPSYDDAGYLAGTYYPNEDTNGNPGYWTTALSSIPYAKQIYTTTQAFISDSNTTVFYRPDVDFLFNMPAALTGDVLRNAPSGIITSIQNGPPPQITIEVTAGVSYQSFPESGLLWAITQNANNATISQYIPYNGRIVSISQNAQQITFDLNATPPSDLGTGQLLYEMSQVLSESGDQPNFTFLNVSPTNAQGLTPGAVLLSEFRYISTNSRNDQTHNISNAVDIFVDGDNPNQASTIFNASTSQQFVTDPTSPWYYENFRRDGQPTKRPQLNNYITPLFYAPVDSLPSSLVLNNQTYYEGWHYWLVHEIGPLGGSIRARDGIEWNPNLGGDTSTTPPTDPTLQYNPTGNSITSLINAGTALEIDNYTYDANVVSVQAAVDGSKQMSTDALVHRANTRYFALDITVVYTAGVTASAVNVGIWNAIQGYFTSLYFGGLIELGMLLEIIYNVEGVANVRWSSDVPNNPSTTRIVEVDINGNPVHGASIDRYQYGSSNTPETQTLYIVGNPDGATLTTGTIPGTPDYFQLAWYDLQNNVYNTVNNVKQPVTTAPIYFWNAQTGLPLSASDIQTAIQAAVGSFSAAPYNTGSGSGITVTEDTRPLTNVTEPIRSFEIVYAGNGTPTVPTVTQTVTSSDYVFNEDFILLDNELPSLPPITAANPLAGLTIRTRAQNTFYRSSN